MSFQYLYNSSVYIWDAVTTSPRLCWLSATTDFLFNLFC